MKGLITIVFVLCTTLSIGQNRSFNLGYNDTGIRFGNSNLNNGIRFNLIDKNVDVINGLNLALVTESNITNGFSLGVLANYDWICNGISINGLVGETYKANGIVISGLGHVSNKCNGLGIGGLAFAGDTLNGLFMSPIGVTFWNTEKIKLINGVAIGLIIGSNTEKMNGLSLSLFNNSCDTLYGVAISAINRSKELHGFQFGLWNIAENNRFLKRTPILNFNLRRRKASR